jgi:hypothetical protein
MPGPRFVSRLLWLTRHRRHSAAASIAALNEGVPRFSDFGRAHGRRGIAPGIADISEDGGNLDRQSGASRIRGIAEPVGALIGGNASRAAQHDMHEGEVASVC